MQALKRYVHLLKSAKRFAKLQVGKLTLIDEFKSPLLAGFFVSVLTLTLV